MSIVAEYETAPGASRPRAVIPKGACDTHSHVFGGPGQYLLAQPSVYALPTSPPSRHAEIRRQLGVDRGVLTQPAPFGTDPTAMIDTIAQSNGSLKGVAVADAVTEQETLHQWRAYGIVGLRFTEMLTPTGARYPGSVGLDALATLAPAMRAAGLHAQLWAPIATIALSLPMLVATGLPIVFDHMGCPDAAKGPNDPDFIDLLAALRSENFFVKLTVCRLSSDYALVRRFHDRLVETAPDRLFWGSDWPYVRMAPAPDAGTLLDLFCDWIPDAAMRHRILVDSPGRFYGFE